MIVLDLPRPISTNRLFRNKAKGRVRTEEYNTWMWQAAATLAKQKPLPKIGGPVCIIYQVGEIGLRASMDGDNCLKCLTDALVSNGVIPDDNRTHVRAIGMEWVPGVEGARAFIRPANETARDGATTPARA